jgi:hypothetical protein
MLKRSPQKSTVTINSMKLIRISELRLMMSEPVKGPANILGLSDYGIHMTTTSGVYSEAPYYQRIDSAYKKVATEVDINALGTRISDHDVHISNLIAIVNGQAATIDFLKTIVENLDPTGFGNLFGLL